MTLYRSDSAPELPKSTEERINEALSQYAELHNEVNLIAAEMRELAEEMRKMYTDHKSVARSFDARAVLAELENMRRVLISHGIQVNPQ